MKSRWGTGIVLGKIWSSDECMIFDDGKLLKVRSVELMLEGESWVAEEIDRVNIPRWKAQFTTAHKSVSEEVDTVVEGPATRPVIPKDFSVRREHLLRHGYTDECGRCRALKRGRDARGTHHTKACRDKLKAIL